MTLQAWSWTAWSGEEKEVARDLTLHARPEECHSVTMWIDVSALRKQVIDLQILDGRWPRMELPRIRSVQMTALSAKPGI